MQDEQQRSASVCLTLPSVNMEAQTGPYKNSSPWKRGYISVHACFGGVRHKLTINLYTPYRIPVQQFKRVRHNSLLRISRNGCPSYTPMYYSPSNFLWGPPSKSRPRFASVSLLGLAALKQNALSNLLNRHKRHL